MLYVVYSYFYRGCNERIYLKEIRGIFKDKDNAYDYLYECKKQNPENDYIIETIKSDII